MQGRLHIDEKIVGLLKSQWLPCPLAIWNLLFGMAILLNLVKSFQDVSEVDRVASFAPRSLGCVREAFRSWRNCFSILVYIYFILVDILCDVLVCLDSK